MSMKIRDLVENANELTTDDVLHMLGLERRGERILPMIGLFSVGVLVGAGVGLFLAPRSGKELRQAILSRVGELRERGMAAAREVRAKTTEAMGQTEERAGYAGEGTQPRTTP
ncbi:MAG: YtxH domain-containing protein [Deltaproteobacteria bacterium]|nr:YtxH domain-containing protein [Deltaproteobacteria bacterium]